ncbi:hypothetical protein ACBQ28_02240 [Pseudomonas lundensis]|uniref:SLOG domain-containing protein n=1 Tax=Pseudomonas lundensis TaxID=86185 RepID=UPI0035252341
MGDIFLSASVPSRDSSFYEQSDPMLIQAALRTFLYTVLGRKHLVFGGHPTISPLILAVCEDLRVDNRAAVTIYQSTFFEQEAPKVNSRFANLVPVNANGTRESSLELMRKVMFKRHKFEAAVFIGGQQGILDEHAQFKLHHPQANVIALRSPGGASASIEPLKGQMQERSPLSPEEKDYDELLDYVGLFTNGLEIGLNSERNLSLKPSKPRHDPDNTFGKG